MTIKDKFKDDRPREKMISKGAAALTDLELLTALIGSGVQGADVTKLARKILSLIRNKGTELEFEDIKSIHGIGNAKAVTVFAALEFWKRQIAKNSLTLDTPEKILPLITDIKTKKQEYFISITLDGANRLIKKRIVTIGTLTASLIHPREVFAPAIEDRAASIVVAHNHPSNTLAPSQADIEVTKRLKDAGELLGIPLVDHIIVTDKQWSSIL